MSGARTRIVGREIMTGSEDEIGKVERGGVNVFVLFFPFLIRGS